MSGLDEILDSNQLAFVKENISEYFSKNNINLTDVIWDEIITRTEKINYREAATEVLGLFNKAVSYGILVVANPNKVGGNPKTELQVGSSDIVQSGPIMIITGRRAKELPSNLDVQFYNGGYYKYDGNNLLLCETSFLGKSGTYQMDDGTQLKIGFDGDIYLLK